MGRIFSLKSFIEKAEQIHNFKYDYSKTVYIKSSEKIIIICPSHGEFLQRASDHLSGAGCKKCKALNPEIYYRQIEQKYKGNILPLKDTFISPSQKMKFECKYHGIIEKQLTQMIHYGCRYCRIDASSSVYKKDNSIFIQEANKVHNYTYDYNKTNYKGCYDKVVITCRIHGDFLQMPSSHLQGIGCRICGTDVAADKHKKDTHDFIIKASKYWGSTYDYSNSVYNGATSPITIICKKHGEFKTTPANHYIGTGCPTCSMSKLEYRVKCFLEKEGISFISQYRIYNCRDKRPLPFDFAIFNSSNKLLGLVECQGEQHYNEMGFHSLKNKDESLSSFQYIINHDKIKYNYCLNNSIPLLLISYKDKEKIDIILYNWINFIILQ